MMRLQKPLPLYHHVCHVGPRQNVQPGMSGGYLISAFNRLSVTSDAGVVMLTLQIYIGEGIRKSDTACKVSQKL